jgi:hypothetical protein
MDEIGFNTSKPTLVAGRNGSRVLIDTTLVAYNLHVINRRRTGSQFASAPGLKGYDAVFTL